MRSVLVICHKRWGLCDGLPHYVSRTMNSRRANALHSAAFYAAVIGSLKALQANTIGFSMTETVMQQPDGQSECITHESEATAMQSFVSERWRAAEC